MILYNLSDAEDAFPEKIISVSTEISNCPIRYDSYYHSSNYDSYDSCSNDDEDSGVEDRSHIRLRKDRFRMSHKYDS